MPNNRNGQNGQALNVLHGPALRRALHNATPAERAQIGAQLVQHGVALANLSAAQVARLVKADPSAICAALGHRGSRGPRQSTIDYLAQRYTPTR